jgi:adenylate kinase
MPHIASGDLLRRHCQFGTPLGIAAQSYMDRGDLVPDQLVVDMVMDRLERPDAQSGALLDGFPRTRAQAQALDSSLAERSSEVRIALYLEVPTDVLVQRLAGRWLCPSCQATYPGGLDAPPNRGRCVGCGDQLYQRPDDRPTVVQNRIEVYLRETRPVIDHYTESGLVTRIDGVGSIEAVRCVLCVSLGGVVHGWRHEHWHLFVERQVRFGNGETAWHGRTLCGKFVDRHDERQFGSEDDFHRQPCRGCRRALRTRQGPIAQALAPLPPGDVAGE